MKKIISTILFSLFVFVSFSQESKTQDEDIYIYIGNQHFIGAVLGYKAIFGLVSKDKRFQHDNYYFKINFRELDYQSLYSLGTPVNVDSINVVKPIEYFKDKSNCDLHTELSLYKRIYIVTDIPNHKLKDEKDKTKKHIMFYSSYTGTLKDWTYPNMTGKYFIDD